MFISVWRIVLYVVCIVLVECCVYFSMAHCALHSVYCMSRMLLVYFSMAYCAFCGVYCMSSTLCLFQYDELCFT